jgi:hypothetical protein
MPRGTPTAMQVKVAKTISAKVSMVSCQNPRLMIKSSMIATAAVSLAERCSHWVNPAIMTIKSNGGINTKRSVKFSMENSTESAKASKAKAKLSSRKSMNCAAHFPIGIL